MFVKILLRINFVTYKECLYKECHGTPPVHQPIQSQTHIVMAWKPFYYSKLSRVQFLPSPWRQLANVCNVHVLFCWSWWQKLMSWFPKSIAGDFFFKTVETRWMSLQEVGKLTKIVFQNAPKLYTVKRPHSWFLRIFVSNFRCSALHIVLCSRVRWWKLGHNEDLGGGSVTVFVWLYCTL
jgi:hypothetical protein